MSDQSQELERLRALAHSITGLLTFDGNDGPSLHDAGYRSIVVTALNRWFEEYEKPRLERKQEPQLERKRRRRASPATKED